MHNLMVMLGLDDPGGPWYLFWSGIGSDLGYLAVGSYLFRKINCHVRWCLRMSLHHVEVNGVRYAVCRKHHPNHPGSKPLDAAILAETANN